MIIQKRLLNQEINIFGTASHFGFPGLAFIPHGVLADLLGGINLLNSRVTDAIFTIVIIILSFYFFRLFLPLFAAFIATLILGVNHSLMAISRMVMVNNTGLLIEVITFGLLFKSIVDNNKFLAFLGGIGAGLCLYVYMSARISLLLWIVFVISLLTFYFIKKRAAFLNLAKLSLITLIAFIFTAAPLSITYLTTKEDDGNYTKLQLLIYPEGRNFAKEWLFVNNETEAIMTNALNGLTVFNNKIHDNGYIYLNPGHGFADSITGFLIWVGFIGILIRWLIKKKVLLTEYFMVFGFLFLLFVFSFIINKSPDYTRLLIILPFAAYFACYGALFLANLVYKLLFKSRLKLDSQLFNKSFLTLVATIIILQNCLIFGDFVNQGLEKGHEVGSTARFMENRPNDYKFYLATDSNYPYYSWGDPSMWYSWFSFFASKNQVAKLITPTELNSLSDTKPFTLFLSDSLWQQNESNLKKSFPNYKIHLIKNNGSLIAFEVL